MPATAEVNATMEELGLPANWSDEAVEQLRRAAAAAHHFLTQYPDEAARLTNDPEAFVRTLTERKLLEGPIDQLLVARRAVSTAIRPATKDDGNG